MMRYFKNILIGLDQFGNVVLGGSPDETISSRVWRRRRDSFIAKIAVNIIDWVALKVFGQENHCRLSLEAADRSQDEVF